jgi:hypothetical protein
MSLAAEKPSITGRVKIHQNYIGLFLQGHVHGTLTVAGLDNNKAVLLEFQAHEETGVLHVFNNQYLQVF